MSPSHGGADRNFDSYLDQIKLNNVALSRGRGSKLHTVLNDYVDESRPLTGARIETFARISASASSLGRPLTGARIETSSVKVSPTSPTSPSHGGADRNCTRS